MIYLQMRKKQNEHENKNNEIENLNDIPNGETMFLKDIENDVNKMSQASIDSNLSMQNLWNLKFSHLGNVFHLVRIDTQSNVDNDDNDENNEDDSKRNIVEDSNDSSKEYISEKKKRTKHACNRMYQCFKVVCQVIWNSIICNILQGKACLENDNTRYLIYRADPHGFDSILISSRLLADHMPQVYMNALLSHKNQTL